MNNPPFGHIILQLAKGKDDFFGNFLKEVGKVAKQVNEEVIRPGAKQLAEGLRQGAEEFKDVAAGVGEVTREVSGAVKDVKQEVRKIGDEVAAPVRDIQEQARKVGTDIRKVVEDGVDEGESATADTPAAATSPVIQRDKLRIRGKDGDKPAETPPAAKPKLSIRKTPPPGDGMTKAHVEWVARVHAKHCRG